MPELSAADMVGTEFGDEHWIEPIICWVLPVQRLLRPGEQPVKPLSPWIATPWIINSLASPLRDRGPPCHLQNAR